MSFFDDNTVQPEEDFDRIEVGMTIKASVEDVWGTIARPGQWVNDRPVSDHEVTRDEHGYYRVNDLEAGKRLVEKGDEDLMDIVFFRRYPLTPDEPPENAPTSVEISLSEESSDTAVHVEESGLSTVTEDDTSARSICEDELVVWEAALTAVKVHLEARAWAVGAHFQDRRASKTRRGAALSGILIGMGALSPSDPEGAR